jgi:D-threo-aldose 1-dehydrogenase
MNIAAQPIELGNHGRTLKLAGQLHRLPKESSRPSQYLTKNYSIILVAPCVILRDSANASADLIPKIIPARIKMAGTLAMPALAKAPPKTTRENNMTNAGRPERILRPEFQFGPGGVPNGNEFEVVTDEDAMKTLEAPWKAGIRYFGASPWYGLDDATVCSYTTNRAAVI